MKRKHGFLTREQRKEKYRVRKIMNDYSLTYRERLIRSLLKAAKDAKAINTRDHISPERKDRVGNFITCLRRELNYKNAREDFPSLTNHQIWSDTLVLSSGWGVTDELKDAVRSAQCRLDEDTENIAVSGLEECNHLVEHAGRILSEAKGIQENGITIVQGIRDVCVQMHEDYTDI